MRSINNSHLLHKEVSSSCSNLHGSARLYLALETTPRVFYGERVSYDSLHPFCQEKSHAVRHLETPDRMSIKSQSESSSSPSASKNNQSHSARTDKTSVPVKSAFCECTFKLTAGFTDSRQVFGSQSLR